MRKEKKEWRKMTVIIWKDIKINKPYLDWSRKKNTLTKTEIKNEISLQILQTLGG